MLEFPLAPTGVQARSEMGRNNIMEAIVRISGKQYRVAPGERVTVDRLATKIGDKVTFDQVLLLTDGAKATIGAPVVDGAAVTATVLAATRGPKLIVYKYKAKKRYRRTQGARAERSLLEVLAVTGPGSVKARPTRTAETEAEKPAKVEARAEEPTAAQKPATVKAAAPATATAQAAKPVKARTARPARAKAEKPTTAETEKPVRTKAAKPPAPKKPAAKRKKKE
jgi:large subunit ribosomal protein L21